MKVKLLFLLLLIPCCIFSQTDKNQELKTITGFIIHESKPLSNVNIFVENAPRFSVSDAKGSYSIKAKVGEIISFNYVGLQKINIFVEDVTSILNINMKLETSIVHPKTVLKLGETTIGDKGVDFKLIHIKGNELNKNAASLTQALQEKTPEFSIKINDFGEEIIYLKGSELNGPALWIIDEVSYDIPIPIFIDEVLKVLVINYGKEGFVINVKTNINYNKVTEINYDNFYFIDEDYYNYDAILYRKIKTEKPSYLNKYKKIKKEQEVLNLYLASYSEDKDIKNYHYGMLSFLEKEKFNKNLLLKVLSDFEKWSPNHPEDLKSIAYKYQELKEHQKALEIYKKLVKIRPEYKQSYRDLANAYLELKNYRNVWFTYNYMLNKGIEIKERDIDEIIASEIISAYNSDTVTNHHKIKIIKPLKNINSDVRLVFEWNTTEAEFIIEFVNPNREVYEIENSIEKNQALIMDQKKNGYTSKEVFIKQLNQGNWLVNFTHLGNKQYKPTTLKITTYYNWGRKKQSKKVDVFSFTEKEKKVKLLKLNNRFLR